MANCTDPIDKRIKESELAEDFFVNVFNRKHPEGTGLCIKYGLGNIQYTHDKQKYLMGVVPPAIRSTPDFIVVENKEFYFVEVKGIKKNLWLKKHDYIWYKEWNELHRVDLFVVNQDSIFAQISMNNLINKIEQNNYEIKKFPNDNKECIVIPFKELYR